MPGIGKGGGQRGQPGKKKPSLNRAAIDRAEQIMATASSSRRTHALKNSLPALPVNAKSKILSQYRLDDSYPSHPCVDEGIDYARKVVAKQIVACEFVQQACARFLAMLTNPKFIFDRDKAERVCRFAEQMPHSKGKWRTTLIEPEPWQFWALVAVFGFYHASDPTRRVVSKVYFEVARKNAKSTLAAIIGLYMLTEDEEEGAEVYSAATTHKQALAIFDTARNMAQRQQGWQAEHSIQVGAQKIAIWGTLSKFEALHAQGETLDGLNVYCALIDELHAHKTRAVYDVLETAIGSRINPLLFNITTAGSNRAGICYEIRAYMLKILSGVTEDYSMFGAVYTIDQGDDWTDPAIWIKANPNLGVSIKREYLDDLLAKAKSMPASVNNFLTKHLNVWVNAGVAWMNMEAWKRCANAPPIEEFKGQDADCAFDLASRVDIACRAFIFQKRIDNLPHYYAYVKHYLPSAATEGAADDDRIAAYGGWVREGHIITTPGDMLDHDKIEEDLLADAAIYHILEACFDPYQATQIMGSLAKEGFTVMEVRPTVLNFSQPMKELQALVLAGQFHHNGDPVLEWMVSNVICHTDVKDNVYPRKDFPENKIDGVIAIIMAMSRAITRAPDGMSGWLTSPIMVG